MPSALEFFYLGVSTSADRIVSALIFHVLEAL